MANMSHVQHIIRIGSDIMSSVVMLCLVTGPPIGRAMWQASLEKQKLPVFIEINKKDEQAVKKMKQLIIDMIQLTPSDRPTMEEVKFELISLQGE